MFTELVQLKFCGKKDVKIVCFIDKMQTLDLLQV